jgi:hypothetical protein
MPALDRALPTLRRWRLAANDALVRRRFDGKGNVGSSQQSELHITQVRDPHDVPFVIYN